MQLRAQKLYDNEKVSWVDSFAYFKTQDLQFEPLYSTDLFQKILAYNAGLRIEAMNGNALP